AVPLQRRRAPRRTYRARRPLGSRAGGAARSRRVRDAARARAVARGLRRGVPDARRWQRMYVVGCSELAVDDARLRAPAQRLGAVVPFGSPLILLTVDREQAEALRRQLATVGYDDVRGVADPVPDTGEDLGRVRVVDARTAKRLSDEGATMLDVRERSEYERAHAPGALHIPYEQLQDRIAEVPRGRDVVVYCAAGVRSSLA